MSIKPLLAFIPSLFISMATFAQAGCTDPAATNYNASATVNDGSCVYPVTHYAPAYRCDISSNVSETSGLTWTANKLWTHNDSGNPAEIYNIDTADGHVIQKVVIDNYPNNDWEAITADSTYLYIGDHGNNNGDRTDLKILKVAKAAITGTGTVHVNAQAIAFSYTDQTSFASSSTHNFDCEALISVRDSLYLFTKDRGDLKTRVYKLPKVPGSYAVSPYASYNVNGLITDASYNAATNEVALIGYAASGHSNSFLWFLNDFQGVQFFSGNKRRIEIGNSNAWATEGITFLPGGRFFISNETGSTYNQALFTGSKAFLTLQVNNDYKNTNIAIYPNPAADVLHINNLEESATYTASSITGQTVCTGSLDKMNNTISFTSYPAGLYLLALTYTNGEKTIMRFYKQ